MQTLTIDTGMQEYLINNRAVLRFNPRIPTCITGSSLRPRSWTPWMPS